MDISGWISGFWSQLGDWANALLLLIMQVLPDSPFQMLTQNADVREVMGYVNYIIPLDFILSTLQAWLVAIGVFYVWQALLRWTKAIE
jgi:hypothetical protein